MSEDGGTRVRLRVSEDDLVGFLAAWEHWWKPQAGAGSARDVDFAYQFYFAYYFWRQGQAGRKGAD